MTTENFRKALPFILQYEGGFVHHPADPGGATNKGVIQVTYNTYRSRKGLPRQSVRHITMAEVEDIYFSMYWKTNKFDLDQLPFKLAQTVFDWHVNSGRGITSLQQVVGLHGRDIDGVLGKQTLNEVEYWANKGKLTDLINKYNDFRESKYRAWGRGAQSVFLRGWLNRLNAVRKITEV